MQIIKYTPCVENGRFRPPYVPRLSPPCRPFRIEKRISFNKGNAIPSTYLFAPLTVNKSPATLQWAKKTSRRTPPMRSVDLARFPRMWAAHGVWMHEGIAACNKLAQLGTDLILHSGLDSSSVCIRNRLRLVP